MEQFYLRCLLCACPPGVTPNLYIFSETCNERHLAEKMYKYLNIQIEPELPQNVCHSCMGKLEGTHELVTSSQQARIMLLQIKQQIQSFAQEVKQEISDGSETELDCYQTATHSAAIHNEMYIKTNEIAMDNSPDSAEEFDQNDLPINDEPAVYINQSVIQEEVLVGPTVKGEMESDQEFVECPPFNYPDEVTFHENHGEVTPMQQDDVATEESSQVSKRRRPTRMTYYEQCTSPSPTPKRRTATRRRTATKRRAATKRTTTRRRTTSRRKAATSRRRTMLGDAVNCDICNEEEKNKYTLILHKNEKHGMNLTFDCEHCGRQFLALQSICNHIRRMHQAKDSFCKVCGELYTSLTHTCTRHVHLQSKQAESTPVQPVFCSICNRRERNKYCLVKHLNTEHLDVLVVPLPYWCERCYKEFNKYRTFVQHIRNVHMPKIKCVHCGKWVKKISMLKHLRTHQSNFMVDQEGIVEKPQGPCEEGFISGEVEIEEHIITLEPSGNQPAADVEPPVESNVVGSQVPVLKLLACASCSFYTSNKTELATHMQTHHQAPSTSDGTIGSQPAISDDWNMSVKNLKCEECKIRYGDPNMFAWHKDNCHGRDAIVKISGDRSHTYECKFCKSVFKGIEHVIKHLHNQHRINNFPFRCKFCNKSFTYTQAVKRHQQICRNRKSGPITFIENNQSTDGVKCRLCNKDFESKTQVKSHIASFHAKKSQPYHCLNCDESFRFYPQLKSHCEGRHPGQNVLQCDVCKDGFSSYTLYMQHKRYKHAGLEYSCTLCPSKFAYPQSLNYHMRIKHWFIEKPVSCKLCDAPFNCKKYLQQHIFRVHLNPIMHCEHCKYISHNKTCLAQHITSTHLKQS